MNCSITYQVIAPETACFPETLRAGSDWLKQYLNFGTKNGQKFFGDLMPAKHLLR
jgi:hypothetical protein